MSESRKRLGVEFWAAAALVAVLVVGYPLSMGPVVWLQSHGVLSDAALNLIGIFYTPLSLIVEPFDWMKDALDRYEDLWR